MENVESNEPKKKRPHLSSVSSPMARNSTNPSNNNKCADVGVLQFQNQQLVQQIDLQKQALHDLEVKLGELKYRQNSYDDMIIAVNELWSQLVDDLVFLGVRAGGGQNAFRSLEHLGNPQESPSLCPVEDIFLSRVIQKDFIETNNHDEVINFVEQALALRQSFTRGLLKLLEDAIDAQIERTYCITQGLEGSASEDVIIQMSKIDDMMKEEANNFHEVIDALHVKHKDYAVAIENYISHHLQDQSEVKCLAGELDESMSELEESRRKLVNLRMQKDAAMGMQSPGSDAVNGTLSPEKPSDKTMGLRELKDSIEEAKIVAADRLSELQEAQEDNLTLRGHLQDRQNELTDDKYVYSSRLYSLVNDQLQLWNTELERYKALTEPLQAERVHVMKWEKELNSKLESVNAARLTADNSDSRIEELELQLQKCTIEKNDIEIEMEEAIQDTGLVTCYQLSV